jgi:hypothetical protein
MLLLSTGHYPALMVVGGNFLGGNQTEDPRNNSILLKPHLAEYCSSNINPIETGRLGNVGKAVINLKISYQ